MKLLNEKRELKKNALKREKKNKFYCVLRPDIDTTIMYVHWLIKSYGSGSIIIIKRGRDWCSAVGCMQKVSIQLPALHLRHVAK